MVLVHAQIQHLPKKYAQNTASRLAGVQFEPRFLEFINRITLGITHLDLPVLECPEIHGFVPLFAFEHPIFLLTNISKEAYIHARKYHNRPLPLCQRQ